MQSINCTVFLQFVCKSNTFFLFLLFFHLFYLPFYTSFTISAVFATLPHR